MHALKQLTFIVPCDGHTKSNMEMEMNLCGPYTRGRAPWSLGSMVGTALSSPSPCFASSHYRAQGRDNFPEVVAQ